MKVLYFFIFGLFFLLLFSCNKNKPPKCDGSATSWNQNIKSIVIANCTTNPACHPKFVNYHDIKYALDNGQFREKVITTMVMPKEGKLTKDELNKIQCWVDAGYPEN